MLIRNNDPSFRFAFQGIGSTLVHNLPPLLEVNWDFFELGPKSWDEQECPSHRAI